MREYAMDQGEFAKFLNIPKTTYCNWENAISSPKLEKAIQIANKLNKDVKEIWYLSL